MLIEPSRINEAWLIFAPHVRCKVGDWENQGWLWFSLLAAIPYSYWRTLGSTVRATLTWNPMFLFLKSNFGSRKETTGKYAGFHAVFSGQSSISLHSCAQNWGVVLWLLYCFTVEVVRAKKSFFFSDYSLFLLFCSLFLKIIFAVNISWYQGFWVVILSTCITCKHPNKLTLGSFLVGLVMEWGHMGKQKQGPVCGHSAERGNPHLQHWTPNIPWLLDLAGRGVNTQAWCKEKSSPAQQ